MIFFRYEILNPDSCTDENHEDLDIGNLLSKMATPTASVGLTELFENIFSLFGSGTQQHYLSDVRLIKLFCLLMYKISKFC